MIVYDCIQGTTEWLALRAGIPTASNFSKIVTPKTRKPSSQATMYMYTLLAERIMGHPCEEAGRSPWMERGKLLEERAAAYYEMLTDTPTGVVGFVSNDTKTIGASPDRLVGSDGLLEIKCPRESTHVAYLLDRQVDADYYPQAQGQLWISERDWVDVLAYHPELPPALIRVERDEKFIALLAEMVGAFSCDLEAKAALLCDRGWIRTATFGGEEEP